MLKYRRTGNLGIRVIALHWFLSLALLIIFALWRVLKWGWNASEPHTTSTTIRVTLTSSLIGCHPSTP